MSVGQNVFRQKDVKPPRTRQKILQKTDTKFLEVAMEASLKWKAQYG
jgi:hypothetical protein